MDQRKEAIRTLQDHSDAIRKMRDSFVFRTVEYYALNALLRHTLETENIMSTLEETGA